MRQRNEVPFEMSQFAVPSREDIPYALKLDNNILIREKDKEGNPVLRHLSMDQYSMLVARRVAKYITQQKEGAQRTMHWDAERDGRIRDYPWKFQEV